MRISDWSSDVCSSDLDVCDERGGGRFDVGPGDADHLVPGQAGPRLREQFDIADHRHTEARGMGHDERKSVVQARRVAVSVDPGGRRIIKKKRKYVRGQPLSRRKIQLVQMKNER